MPALGVPRELAAGLPACSCSRKQTRRASESAVESTSSVTAVPIYMMHYHYVCFVCSALFRFVPLRATPLLYRFVRSPSLIRSCVLCLLSCDGKGLRELQVRALCDDCGSCVAFPDPACLTRRSGILTLISAPFCCIHIGESVPLLLLLPSMSAAERTLQP
jgi:hypothetical protein